MERLPAVLLSLALVGALQTANAQIEKWPEKPVRIIVGFAAGGGTDALARTLAVRLSEELGQQFIVENRPGAGGTIGAEFVARSNPDGYTVTLVSAGYAAASNPALYKLSFDPIRGIATIAMI